MSFAPSGIQRLWTHGGAERLPDDGTDLAAAADMLDPEFPDRGVVAAERVPAVGIGMTETGRVEVESHLVFTAPVHPALEMDRLDRVTVDHLAAEVAVHRVQIQPVRSGDERCCLEDIPTQFIDRARRTRIPPGHLDAAGGRGVGMPFESADIVPLPAMQGERDRTER